MISSSAAFLLFQICHCTLCQELLSWESFNWISFLNNLSFCQCIASEIQNGLFGSTDVSLRTDSKRLHSFLITRMVRASCQRAMPCHVRLDAREVKPEMSGNYSITEPLMQGPVSMETLSATWRTPPPQGIWNPLWWQKRALFRNHSSPKCH